MEHLPVRPEIGIAARVVPLNAGWSDVGAWDALWDVMPRDPEGNASVGETLAVDSSNTLLFAETALVATVGVDNLVVVQTPDAVLVANKQKAKDVEKIVSQLKTQKRVLASTHRKVHRP